jgi:hypothetical protein
MGNMASTPPHADVQSGGKKDISYVDYNEANTLPPNMLLPIHEPGTNTEFVGP